MKRGFRLISSLLLVLLIGTSCNKVNPNYQEEAATSEYLHRSLQKLTDVIVHDIFSPPVASRIYVYASIAAYEAMVPMEPEYRSLAGQLKELSELPQPDSEQEYCYSLASVYALLLTGKELIFSEEKITEFEKEILQEYKAIGMPTDVFDRSLAYGEKVSKHILEWANEDNYKETRSYPKYTIQDDRSTWRPTPPGYMDGIEPHWREIRTFVLDSATQYVPDPPTPFSMDTSSQFYKETMEVYKVMQVSGDEKKERMDIASFWDCNPYVAHQQGHVMFATKKITPGGHWMGIAYIAARKSEADWMKSAETYALTAIALADGFISCWDEKYRSNLVRPETVINEHIDEDWVPALQTPPFPEHTSGHSVISTAAAIALTSIYGENFSFVDDTEVRYGLAKRSFDSFLEASQEAAISRLYGGIHYRPAIDYGVDQGKKVGEFVIGNIELKK